VLETQTTLIDALIERGFSAATKRPFFRYHSMALQALEAPVLPAGFRLRHVEFGEAEMRARVHRAGWADFGSTLSTQTYADVMATWPYRPELDWVVEAPDGEPVASALAWLDDVNRSGLLEPVGCAPAYRRQGLARAVNLACLRALRDAGAETGHVNPRGDPGYPVPELLYRGIGFEPGPRTVSYVRSDRCS
jgi:predicted N-acetyltransferase YhbS